MVILDLYSIFISLRRKKLFFKKKLRFLTLDILNFSSPSNSLCLKNHIFNFNVLLTIHPDCIMLNSQIFGRFVNNDIWELRSRLYVVKH